MSKNALQTCYELVTDVLQREFVAKILNCSKHWPQWTQELQEVTTDNKIQLRTSQTEYVSATNPKIYQFMVISGSLGCCVIRPLDSIPVS